jgi:cation transport regulator ChaC
VETDGIRPRRYFAYGSNMDRAQMKKRCPTARLEGPAHLMGWRYLVMEHGYATVLPAPGRAVYGLAWQLGSEDESSLDRYEGVAQGLYRKQDVEIELMADGRRVPAFLYVASSRVPGRPCPGYQEAVVAAAAREGLPADYVDELRGWLPPGRAW